MKKKTNLIDAGSSSDITTKRYVCGECGKTFYFLDAEMRDSGPVHCPICGRKV